MATENPIRIEVGGLKPQQTVSNRIMSKNTNSNYYPPKTWQRAGNDVYDCIQNTEAQAKLGFTGKNHLEISNQ